ncbi:probable CCR4-associated factor 1 homolog 6 [Nymphaea colorata]|uniref:probable CCR4-associated factor 1 homolog 6 n=1 Tax=Nymphaea colorata TaxID=210225 RepID=UPI00129E61E5|nr:probable CCR4-associated factor 1 homolog 6 [Nymphaea colorata]
MQILKASIIKILVGRCVYICLLVCKEEPYEPILVQLKSQALSLSSLPFSEFLLILGPALVSCSFLGKFIFAMINFDVLVKHVWEDNFDEEMSIIRNSVVTNYPVISLATHFPSGADRVPTGTVWGDPAANYSALLGTTERMAKLTQVGLAFSDQNGHLPCCGETGRPCVWEFSLTPPGEAADPDREEDLSKGSGGGVRAKKGINPWSLAADLWRCNLLMNDNVSWVVFKGGLDFVALLRWARLSVQGLPAELDEFLRLQRLYFPVCHDMAAAFSFHPLLGDDGTIHVLARSLCVRMEEMPPSRAASDCLLALYLFITMKSLPFGFYLLKHKLNAVFGLTAEEEADYDLPTLSNMSLV